MIFWQCIGVTVEPKQERVMICPACNSEISRKEAVLGRLGSLMHYRCPACGMTFNRKVPAAKLKKAGVTFLILFAMAIPTTVRAEYNLKVNAWKLVVALEKAENPSGNVNLVGDKHLKHKAYGLLQIRQPYLDDVNKIAKADVKRLWGKSKLTIKDMKDPVKARWAFKVYLSYYGARYEKITGMTPTMEVYAKIHNGGPDGWKRGNWDTAVYWAKVVRLNGLSSKG